MNQSYSNQRSSKAESLHRPTGSDSKAALKEAVRRSSNAPRTRLKSRQKTQNDEQPKPHKALSDWQYIGSLFLSTRLVLVAIGLIAYRTVPAGLGKSATLSNYAWLDMWGVWDSFWYIDIAQNGYSIVGWQTAFPDQTNLAFFPLYPLLMKLLGPLTGNNYFLSGLLVSNLALLLSAYLLYQLIRLEQGEKIARRAVKYLFIFPVSFILSGLFTESLYLCLTLLCFYLAKRRQWWLAGLCGAALSATRTLGVLIVLPLAFEYLRSVRFAPKAIRWNSLFVLLVPLGLVAFSLYSYQLTGDFLFFKTNQAAWDREVVNPLLAFWEAISQSVTEHSVKKLLEVCFFIAAFGVLTRFYRQLGFSYWLLGMYSIIIPLSAGIASMPRFTLPIFPLYVGLALIGRKQWRDRTISITFGLLQGALMVLWCTGQGLVI